MINSDYFQQKKRGRKSDYWYALSEVQNSCQNQILPAIIYQEKMPDPKLDYFARKKSEYIFAFWQSQINNYGI